LNPAQLASAALLRYRLSVHLRPLFFLGFALSAAACFAPPNAADRLAEAANNLNVATRFGRMDVAAESVAASARAQFGSEHRGWGHDVRIVDLEMNGVELASRDEATVYVTVSWQREGESIVRTTTLAQSWKNDGRWRLESEDRRSGDVGLLGERVVVVDPPAPPPAQFPTRVIRGD
jgi:hypothetical protein